MFSSERHAQIVACMKQYNTVSVLELSKQLYVSPSTIRRDLSELELQGVLKRVHGGAVLTSGSTYDTPHNQRLNQHLAEKQCIANLARQFLSPSASYFFDSSTTTSILARYLADYPNVVLATNGLEILSTMRSDQNISIISCGGYLRSPWGEFTGNTTLKAIADMNADTFFFSCAGFTLEQGAMELSGEHVAVKRAFLNQSKRHILLIDSTKFNRTFFYNAVSINEIDYIITDANPGQTYVEQLGDKLIFP